MHRWQWSSFTTTTLGTLLIAVTLAGCYHRIHRAVDCYRDGACAVQIGMAEEAFIAMLSPEVDTGGWDREPTQFSQGDSVYTVYYLPAAGQTGAAAHGDDLIPYTFRDRRLVAIGLGQLQARRTPLATYDITPRDAESVADSAGAPGNALDDLEEAGSLRDRGPYKWCVPDLTGNGRCLDGPCC